jgi:hypothetical protein
VAAEAVVVACELTLVRYDDTMVSGRRLRHEPDLT